MSDKCEADRVGALASLLAKWDTSDVCMRTPDIFALVNELRARVAELEAVFAGQPRTADGVLLQPGMVVWLLWDRGHSIYAGTVQAVSANGVYTTGTTALTANWWPCAEVFSTHEAAEVVREELGDAKD